uniref:Uncharacterized protein n=1 Tax=Caenorhabditis japonica TaxID=281687 RepID=A0A8R1HVN1_CAEJA
MIDTKLTTGSQDGQVKTSFGNVDMIKKDESLAKFPEFPIIGIDTESSTLDENSSINTSIEDEGSYDYEDMIIVDREENFDTPDLAEEAIVVEERAKNDKIYRCVMSEMVIGS